MIKEVIITIDVEKDINKDTYTGVLELENFLKKFKEIPVTLFITPMALKKSEYIKNKGFSNVDVGLHMHPEEFGYDKKLNQLEYRVIENLIREGKFVFRKYNIFPIAFRAGEWKINFDILKILKEQNILIDSSFYPLEYNVTPNIIFRKYGIREVPLNSFAPLALSLLRKNKFLYYKLGSLFAATEDLINYLGVNILKLCLNFYNSQDYIMVIVHSYDFLDLKFCNKFEKIINHFKTRNFNFSTVKKRGDIK